MLKVLSSILILILLTGICSAQKAVIECRVLGSNGKVLPKVFAEVFNTETNNFAAIQVDENGLFKYETSKKFIWFRISGVSHKCITLPVIIENAPIIKFDVCNNNIEMS